MMKRRREQQHSHGANGIERMKRDDNVVHMDDARIEKVIRETLVQPGNEGVDADENDLDYKWWKPIVSCEEPKQLAKQIVQDVSNEFNLDFFVPRDEEVAIEYLLRNGYALVETCESTTSCYDETISGAVSQCITPITTESQIYTIIEDWTAADRAISQLVSRGSIMKIKLASLPNDYGLVRCADVVRLAVFKANQNGKHHSRNFRNNLPFEVNAIRFYINNLLKNVRGETEISGSQIVERFVSQTRLSISKAQDCISYLVSSGFLRRGDSFEDIYIFSLPGIGKLVSSLVLGRSFVQKTLKRRKYPELLQREMTEKIKKVENCHIDVDYLLRDMRGLGLLIFVNTTVGTLLRLGRLGVQ